MIPPHVALTLEDMAFSLVRAERERDTYRELLGAALSQLHQRVSENRRLQARLHQFFDRQPLGYLDDQQRGYAA
jgi:hypothetical protein